MLYVSRDDQGRIVELHSTPLSATQESLPSDHPDVLQYLHDRWRQSELDQLDRGFVRAVEDLIELLIAKEVILFTDLPAKVQEKLLRRKEVRQQTHYLGDMGIGGDDIIPL